MRLQLIGCFFRQNHERHRAPRSVGMRMVVGFQLLFQVANFLF